MAEFWLSTTFNCETPVNMNYSVWFRKFHCIIVVCCISAKHNYHASTGELVEPDGILRPGTGYSSDETQFRPISGISSFSGPAVLGKTSQVESHFRPRSGRSSLDEPLGPGSGIQNRRFHIICMIQMNVMLALLLYIIIMYIFTLLIFSFSLYIHSPVPHSDLQLPSASGSQKTHSTVKLEEIPTAHISDIGFMEFAKVLDWWKILATYLDLTQPQILAVQNDHHNDQERKFHMLLQWQQIAGIDSTWRSLARACQHWGRHDLVHCTYHLCKYLIEVV